MIEGCLDWQKHRLVRPDVVKVATAEYFEAQDTMADWLAAKCKVDFGNTAYTATTKELFESWLAYTKALNEPSGTERTFSDSLEKRGFPRNKNVPIPTGRVRGSASSAWYPLKRSTEGLEMASDSPRQARSEALRRFEALLSNVPRVRTRVYA
jgi:phage/plasmid-associated DNA primase